MLQIAGVILILSLLWSVYEAYSNGGDVRLLGVAAVKYLVLGLVFLNYQSAFRAVNTMFNGVADGIYNLSGGLDVIKAWSNSLSASVADTNPNWFSSLWNLVTGGISAIVAGLITLVGYLILPFTYTLVHALLRPLRIDPVRGRSVCPGLDPIARARPTGQNLLREHDDLPVLGPAVRNLAVADVGAADHRSNAI